LKTKTKLTIAASALALLALVAATPARAVLTRLAAHVVPLLARHAEPAHTPAPVSVSTAVVSTVDVEQRARAAHGWTSSVVNSVARGSIIFYDSTGRATGQFGITISRAYPDKVRFEVNRGTSTDISGFDHTTPWKAGVANLSDTAARDIRALARICPERLFATRDTGAAYREVGQRIEDIAQTSTAPDPDAGLSPVVGQQYFDQVEMRDSLGPAPTKTNPGDVRRIYYYVDQATSMVSTARWLEPDNPKKSIDDATASFTDIRVDFGDWRDVGGLKMPFRVMHSTGGRVDFRIVLNDVNLNQSLAPNTFQGQ